MFVASAIIAQEEPMKIERPYWPRVSPSLFYDEPAAAIDWLCRAFGFEVRLKVEGEPGQILHSELMIGDGLIMVGDSKKAPGRVSPRSIGGGNTQSIMVHVEDVEAHCKRARGAGAKILKEPETHDYGEDYWADRSYEAEDPEGHRWWISQRVRNNSK
jgi:uncharacterized glyoxalase superfamily protein PhnB